MEVIFVNHPYESLRVFRSVIQTGFIPSIFLSIGSLYAICTAPTADAFIHDALLIFQCLRLALAVVGLPLRLKLLQTTTRLLEIQQRHAVVAGILEMMDSPLWRIHQALGNIAIATLGGGIMVALSGTWSTIGPEFNVLYWLVVLQIAVSVPHMIVTMYRFALIGMDADGLNTLREAQGATKEELASHTQMMPFKSMPPHEAEAAHECACAVCYAPYESDQMVRRLPCAHVYHAECIDGWLATKSVCPSCSHSISQPHPKSPRNAETSALVAPKDAETFAATAPIAPSDPVAVEPTENDKSSRGLSVATNSSSAATSAEVIPTQEHITDDADDASDISDDYKNDDNEGIRTRRVASSIMMASTLSSTTTSTSTSTSTGACGAERAAALRRARLEALTALRAESGASSMLSPSGPGPASDLPTPKHNQSSLMAPV